jgi:uncharacterized protein
LLTADMVRARRRGDELRLTPLNAAARAEAEELAAALLAIAAAHVGATRADVEDSWDTVVASARDRRLAAGLCKLVEDRCGIEPDAALDAAALRRSVFLRASATWRELSPGAHFDRNAVLEAAASEHGLSSEALELGLYADLREAHCVTAFEPVAARHLVEAYELAQAQAVLLRAVRVVAVVECATPGAYRALFHKLKFLRLLYTISPQPSGYQIEIDGPFSLFESGTKYGLQLALALPALRECDAWSLTADVRWGTARTPLRFSMTGSCTRPAGTEPASTQLPDELAALVDGIAKLETPWRAECAQALLDLPGVGLCVPDLVFQHRETGECVYLEVLGYWSRDAVWRRVELVQQGLGEPILFAVGKHLRVSEEVLSEDLPGALYVYKRTMIPRTILDRVEALARVPR